MLCVVHHYLTLITQLWWMLKAIPVPTGGYVYPGPGFWEDKVHIVRPYVRKPQSSHYSDENEKFITTHTWLKHKKGVLTQKQQLPKNNSVPQISTNWGIFWFQLKRRKFAPPAKFPDNPNLESRTWTGYNKGGWGDAELTDNSQLKGKLTRCFKDWCPDRRVICLVPLGEPSNPLGGRWKKGVWWWGVSVWDKHYDGLWWRTICQQESSLNRAQSCSTGPETWLKICMKWNTYSSFFFLTAEVQNLNAQRGSRRKV